MGIHIETLLIIEPQTQTKAATLLGQVHLGLRTRNVVANGSFLSVMFRVVFIQAAVNLFNGDSFKFGTSSKDCAAVGDGSNHHTLP